jgi:DNA-binding transcriptional ArsR family regulator
MIALYKSRERANEAVEKIKTYAQPQRLTILSFLLEGERTVGEIDEATGVGQPALSQQLAELRRADLVATRRAAKQIYYRLAGDDISLCVRTIEAIFGGNGNNLAAALSEAVDAPSKPIAKARGSIGAASFAKLI